MNLACSLLVAEITYAAQPRTPFYFYQCSIYFWHTRKMMLMIYALFRFGSLDECDRRDSQDFSPTYTTTKNERIHEYFNIIVCVCVRKMYDEQMVERARSLAHARTHFSVKTHKNTKHKTQTQIRINCKRKSVLPRRTRVQQAVSWHKPFVFPFYRH